VQTNPWTKDGVTEDFLKKFPQGKVPGFEKGDYLLSEVSAIAWYLASQSDKAKLLGTNKEEEAEVAQWFSWANNEFLGTLQVWFRPLAGLTPYRKDIVAEGEKGNNVVTALFEDLVKHRTFLVGERLTAADIMVAAFFGRAFQTVFDAAWRQKHPNIVRYYKTVANQPNFVAVAGEPKFIEEAIKYTPPAKEKKPEKPAAAAAAPAPAAAKKDKKKKDDDDEEDEPSVPAEPKAKHPCEALGPAKSFPLDELKRQYSNNEYVDSFKWLEEHFDPQEYSLWRAKYKYNDELTQVFMSSNLIGGFHNRLEGSRKYLFGIANVYGTANNSVIEGAYIIRGSDFKGVFDVAPDWESYEFSPLDIKADKDYILGVWSGENKVEGKEYADGKAFK